MADLISREAVKNKIGFVNLYFRAHGQEKYLDDLIDEVPAVDAVSREVLEQIKWERDIAMEQLEAHGISFGAKTLDCDGCIYANRKRPQKCSCCRRNRDMKDCYEEEK